MQPVQRGHLFTGQGHESPELARERAVQGCQRWRSFGGMPLETELPENFRLNDRQLLMRSRILICLSSRYQISATLLQGLDELAFRLYLRQPSESELNGRDP